MTFAVAGTCPEHGAPEIECAECVAEAVLTRSGEDSERSAAVTRACLALAAVGLAFQRIADRVATFYSVGLERKAWIGTSSYPLVAQIADNALDRIDEALGLTSGEGR